MKTIQVYLSQRTELFLPPTKPNSELHLRKNSTILDKIKLLFKLDF